MLAPQREQMTDFGFADALRQPFAARARAGRRGRRQLITRNSEQLLLTMITIGIHYLDDIASVDVRGKFIKGQGGFQLQRVIDKALEAGTEKILLNMTDVPMVDSMGIGEIVRAFTRVKEAGGTLKLVGLTSRVYGAMKITRLLSLIESYKTEQEAAASFPPAEAHNGRQAEEEPAKPRRRKKAAAKPEGEAKAEEAEAQEPPAE
jgi:anti-sigma B factor antagonist